MFHTRVSHLTLNPNLKNVLVGHLLDIRNKALRNIAQSGEDAYIILTVPGRWGKANNKRLNGRKGPLGSIIGEDFRPHPIDDWERLYYCICDFKAREVVNYIDKFLKENDHA